MSNFNEVNKLTNEQLGISEHEIENRIPLRAEFTDTVQINEKYKCPVISSIMINKKFIGKRVRVVITELLD